MSGSSRKECVLDTTALQNVLGYKFRRPELAEQMVTTRSVVSDEGVNLAIPEHRGDALIYFLLWELLYKRYPDASTRLMSDMRAQIVSNKRLNRLAARLNLLRFVRTTSVEHVKFKTLANVMEAIFGAIFEDAGGVTGDGVDVLFPILERLFALEIEMARFDEPEERLRSHLRSMGYKVSFEYSATHQAWHVRGPKIQLARVELESRRRSDLRVETFGIATAQNNPTEKARRAAAALALLELFPDEYPCNLSLGSEVWEFPEVTVLLGKAIPKPNGI